MQQLTKLEKMLPKSAPKSKKEEIASKQLKQQQELYPRVSESSAAGAIRAPRD
jgi:hypothetical protein